MTKGGVKQT